MPSIFPTLASGSMKVDSSLSAEALIKGSVNIASTFLVSRVQFLNDTEQRWVTRNELFSATITYSNLSGYDFSILLAFFKLHRGAYVDSALINTFSFTLFGTTYDYCVFDQDSIDSVVNSTDTHSFTLKIKQLRPN